MRTELIQDLLHHLSTNDSFKIGYADEGTTRLLEHLEIPLDLKRTLQWYWTTSGGAVGAYTLNSVNSVLTDSDFPALFQCGMIPIGFASNGDILVIRIKDDNCEIGLVSHDQFWEDECDSENAYVEVAPTIEEYLWRAVEGRYLPRNYYSAADLAELRTEVGESKFDKNP